MHKFTLGFPPSEIGDWAQKYNYRDGDAAVIAIGKAARQQGFLTRAQFLEIAGWKSSRPAKRHARNDDAVVREVTRFAFGTPIESLRLPVLTLLHGVEARTASAILHLCYADRYPMMDVRAFWSLRVVKPPTDWLAMWDGYAQTCRAIADKAGVDLRTLDRALWAYSLAKQP